MKQSLFEQYYDLNETVKGLNNRKKELKKRIFASMKQGSKEDEKGNLYAYQEGDGVTLEAKKERRYTAKLNDKLALDYLMDSDNKDLLELCTEMKQVIYEPGIEQAIIQEMITPESVEGFTDVKETWALKVKKIEKEK